MRYMRPSPIVEKYQAELATGDHDVASERWFENAIGAALRRDGLVEVHTGQHDRYGDAIVRYVPAVDVEQ